MQAVESQTLILYHTDLRGEWPGAAARALGTRLHYGKRLATEAEGQGARATLAGIALALHALARLLGRRVAPGELLFERGVKPRLADAAADFSISHSGPWVGCAALCGGRVGFDVEVDERAHRRDWVAREAALKAAGLGVTALGEVALAGEQAHCRGARWYAQRPRLFTDAAACVMTDRALPPLLARALPLAELFAL